MTDYIKRTDAVKISEKYGLANGSVLGRHTGLAECIASEISGLPAADVAQVRHGRWEWDTEDIYRCSNCAEKSHVKEVMGHPEWEYCPNCGAKMDGGDGNSDMA